MTAAQILSAYAPAAGLTATIVPSTFGTWLMCDVRSLGPGEAHHPLSLDGPRPCAPAAPLMAPMAGVTDVAYRLMARAGGAALAYTEMVSVNGLHYGSDKTWELVVPDPAEPDVAVQLFGADPSFFEEASRAVLARLGSRLALIDINMACPMPKVTRGGAGSALLGDPTRAAAIVQACVRGVRDRVPVTAKIRMGRHVGEDVSVPFARTLAAAGVAAVAVHGRTATQLYTGSASWDAVRAVACTAGVPVIGTGDVRDACACVRMRAETGVAAVMVARGSYGNPWVFADAACSLGGESVAAPTVGCRIAALECHLRLLAATGAHMARGRSLCGWYLRGLSHAAAWRNAAMSCVVLDDYLHLIDALRLHVEADDGECA